MTPLPIPTPTDRRGGHTRRTSCRSSTRDRITLEVGHVRREVLDSRHAHDLLELGAEAEP